MTGAAPSPAEHWERAYRATSPVGLSWFEAVPTRSIAGIQQAGAPLDAPILDVGGGTSLLVDNLLALGYGDLTVLDLSASALGCG